MLRIDVNTAAALMDKAPQYVRLGLQQQRLPFGSAVKTSSHWDYHISLGALCKYLGEDPKKILAKVIEMEGKKLDL